MENFNTHELRDARQAVDRLEAEDHALKLRIKELRGQLPLASRKERKALLTEVESLRSRRAELRDQLHTSGERVRDLRAAQTTNAPGLRPPTA